MHYTHNEHANHECEERIESVSNYPAGERQSGSTRTDRPPGDETANNEIANLNGGNPTITSGRDHVIVAARSADGSTQIILDS